MSENQEVLQNCFCRRLAYRLLGVASLWSLEHLGGLMHACVFVCMSFIGKYAPLFTEVGNTHHLPRV